MAGNGAVALAVLLGLVLVVPVGADAIGKWFKRRRTIAASHSESISQSKTRFPEVAPSLGM